MAKIFYPDFFNDVFGPIMQPGSSGSFGGTSRVGRIARYTLKSEPKRVRILFNPSANHMRSLGNMMDDRAYLAGLQDYPTDDINLFYGHERAREKGISYEFSELEKDNEWPGSVTFELTGTEGDTSVFVGKSIGGGMVMTYSIHGFPVHWQADTYGVLAWGKDEDILKKAQHWFAQYSDELVETTYYKDNAGNTAAFFEFSTEPEKEKLGELFNESVEYRLLPALLPVVTIKNRKEQLFHNVEEWRQAAKDRNISFVEAAIEYEKNFSGWSAEKIWEYFEKINDILYAQIHSLEQIGYENAKDTPNLPIYGKNWDKYAASGKVLEGPITERIIRSAMATNAKIPGVKIVPVPWEQEADICIVP
jgi:L-serine dehydratase